MKKAYSHTEGVHNLSAPQKIVPVIMDLLKPASVLDAGCGLGTFLYCFKQQGVERVLGVDAAWVDKKLLAQYLEEDEFQEVNLAEGFEVKQPFDLAVSLEVAEHLPERSADRFVESLVKASKIVLFSAAIPLQGGQHHINEQWLPYWEEKFKAHGYQMHDILRPVFWENEEVFWWYKQNMVLFTAPEIKLEHNFPPNLLKDVVHKELFAYKSQRLDDLVSGRAGLLTYLRYLAKALIGPKNAEKVVRFLQDKNLIQSGL